MSNCRNKVLRLAFCIIIHYKTIYSTKKERQDQEKGRIQVYGNSSPPQKKVEYNLITMHKQIRTENKYNLDRHAEKYRFQKIGIQHFAMESPDEFLMNEHKQIRAA